MGKSIENRFMLMLLVLIGSMPLLDLIYPAKLDGVSRVVPISAKLILFISLLFFFIRNQKKWWFSNSIGKILTVFIIVHILYLLVSSADYVTDFYKISKTLVWFFGFFFFLEIGYRRSLSERQINRFFIIVSVLIFFLVLYGVTTEAFFKSNRNYGASNFAYYLLFVFPFLFMHKQVSYRSIIFTMMTIGVAISFKRGTMLLYVVMVIYLLFFSKLEGIAGKRFSKFFRLLIICVILLVLYQVVFSNFDSYADKFSDVSDVNENNLNEIGSGRGTLYLLPLERWINSNPFHFVVGYGFNATPQFYPTTGVFKKGFYAHSDFVMLIHDYGMIGLTLLLSLFYRLFKEVKRSVLVVDKVPLVLVFLALLIKALFSGFIIYEYSIYGFAVLGLILGRRRRRFLDEKYQYDKQVENKNI